MNMNPANTNTTDDDHVNAAADDDDCHDLILGQWERQHLEWSAKQGRILTDSGNALRYYSRENGFPFVPSELPHYYLERGDSDIVFKQWAKIMKDKQYTSPIIGVWDRPIFAGRWEHTTNEDEIVYNVQTATLFVDLRIPRSKPVMNWEKLLKHPQQQHVHDLHSSRQEEAFQSMSGQDLRMFARQHVFGGFSLLSTMEGDVTHACPTEHHRSLLCCTRHHCIDWNYIPRKPRPRPNKWYIDMLLSKDDEESASNSNTTSVGKSPLPSCNVWKELSYSTDENGQCYYYEIWKRRIGDKRGEGLRLAMRRKRNRELDVVGGDDNIDGIFVVVGDHFNYILGRTSRRHENKYYHVANLVELVDTAIEHGDRETAISYLSLDGGHGTISSGWKIDCSIQPWHHGMRVFDRIGGDGGVKVVVESSGDDCDFFAWDVTIGNSSWEIYECSVGTAIELEILLNHNGDDNSRSRL